MRNNFGFTLIELLVVVLIIGILASIALPQYRLATDKVEAMRALPILKAVKNMQEMYYLANGNYAESYYDIDYDQLGDCTVISNTVALCGPHRGRMVMNKANMVVEYPLRGSEATLQQFYSRAGSRGNWVRCGGSHTDRKERLCKVLGADKSTESTNTNGAVYWRVPL